MINLLAQNTERNFKCDGDFRVTASNKWKKITNQLENRNGHVKLRKKTWWGDLYCKKSKAPEITCHEFVIFFRLISIKTLGVQIRQKHRRAEQAQRGTSGSGALSSFHFFFDLLRALLVRIV